MAMPKEQACLCATTQSAEHCETAERSHGFRDKPTSSNSTQIHGAFSFK
jgi:hypothetical protein